MCTHRKPGLPEVMFIEMADKLQEGNTHKVLGNVLLFSPFILLPLSISCPLLPGWPLSTGSRWFPLTRQKPCWRIGRTPESYFFSCAKPFCDCCQAGRGVGGTACNAAAYGARRVSEECGAYTHTHQHTPTTFFLHQNPQSTSHLFVLLNESI